MCDCDNVKKTIVSRTVTLQITAEIEDSARKEMSVGDLETVTKDITDSLDVKAIAADVKDALTGAYDDIKGVSFKVEPKPSSSMFTVSDYAGATLIGKYI